MGEQARIPRTSVPWHSSQFDRLNISGFPVGLPNLINYCGKWDAGCAQNEFHWFNHNASRYAQFPATPGRCPLYRPVQVPEQAPTPTVGVLPDSRRNFPRLAAKLYF
jgi:hypothetical protein